MKTKPHFRVYLTPSKDGVVFDLRRTVAGRRFAARIAVPGVLFEAYGRDAATLLDAIVNDILPRKLRDAIDGERGRGITVTNE